MNGWNRLYDKYNCCIDIPANSKYPIRYGGYLEVLWPVLSNVLYGEDGRTPFLQMHYGLVYVYIFSNGSKEISYRDKLPATLEAVRPYEFHSLEIGGGVITCEFEYEVYDWSTQQHSALDAYQPGIHAKRYFDYICKL